MIQTPVLKQVFAMPPSENAQPRDPDSSAAASVPAHDAGSPARDRLLHAAGEAFARDGFDGASVRAICEAAGANVSAVKYHFGSKHDLYREVVVAAHVQMHNAEPMPELPADATPTQARETLADFVAWFMRLVLSEADKPPWAGRLLACETVQPTDALDEFVRLVAGPIRGELHRIVRAVIGDAHPDHVADDLTHSVIALCVNPKHSFEILSRLGFPPPTDVPSINRMAHTVARFALSGLDGFAADSPP